MHSAHLQDITQTTPTPRSSSATHLHLILCVWVAPRLHPQCLSQSCTAHPAPFFPTRGVLRCSYTARAIGYALDNADVVRLLQFCSWNNSEFSAAVLDRLTARLLSDGEAKPTLQVCTSADTGAGAVPVQLLMPVPVPSAIAKCPCQCQCQVPLPVVLMLVLMLMLMLVLVLCWCDCKFDCFGAGAGSGFASLWWLRF